jgi:O-succinylbenzoic acid--CoA ligase
VDARVILDEPLPTTGEPIEGGVVHDLDAPAPVAHPPGTTANPAPVELTYGNWLWSALGSAAALGSADHDRWLCTLPLVHVGGLSILVRSAYNDTQVLFHESPWTLSVRCARSRTARCLGGSDDAAPHARRGPARPRRRCAARCSAARRARLDLLAAAADAGVPVAQPTA